MKHIQEKDIAVVGVSDREEKFGYKIFKDLLKHGFNVYPVNPRNGVVLGKKVYKSIRDIERVPDLVITVVPPQVTEKIVEECRLMGVKEIWMQPGSESEKAIENAHRYGIAVTYNACFMIHSKVW